MSRYTRLHITSEGQSEERFVKDTLAPYLGSFNISTDVRCVLTSRDSGKTYRGGLISYNKAKADLLTWIKEDKNPDVRFTTMFDLYALPDDFPGYNEAGRIRDAYRRVEFLESEFSKDINDYRFIPYLQLHEFESLLLAKPEVLGLEFFEYPKEIEELKKLSQETGNPEFINDNPKTAPSKRIIKIIPEYEKNKVAVGAAVAGIIGIDYLKRTCRHFNDWITKLEQLPTSPIQN